MSSHFSSVFWCSMWQMSWKSNFASYGPFILSFITGSSIFTDGSGSNELGNTWHMKTCLCLKNATCFTVFKSIFLSESSELNSHDPFEQYEHTCKMSASSSSFFDHQCFFFISLDLCFIYISNGIPFPCYFSKNPYPIPFPLLTNSHSHFADLAFPYTGASSFHRTNGLSSH